MLPQVGARRLIQTGTLRLVRPRDPFLPFFFRLRYFFGSFSALEWLLRAWRAYTQKDDLTLLRSRYLCEGFPDRTEFFPFSCV